MTVYSVATCEDGEIKMVAVEQILFASLAAMVFNSVKML